MTWRTIVGSSGITSHAFEGNGGAVCGRYAYRDSRESQRGERRCKACERVLRGREAVKAAAASARQGGLFS